MVIDSSLASAWWTFEFQWFDELEQSSRQTHLIQRIFKSTLTWIVNGNIDLSQERGSNPKSVAGDRWPVEKDFGGGGKSGVQRVLQRLPLRHSLDMLQRVW
jgi:hypothetical protein